MTHQAVGRCALILLTAVASVACAESAVAPSAAERVESPTTLARPQAEPGQYDIEFLWNGELVIIAHVRDASGAAPTGGSVTIQYCSLKGLPPGDITQPDEAPSSACGDGSGRWRNVIRGSLDESGDFGVNFGVVSVVTVIGFRVVYSPQGSNVAAGSVIEDWYRPL
jgi:hypothetical protein